eukprot:CAMPEP_0173253942 /NCGR_PEP_ID=MMETSP1142-20121109/21628_1 /TAXON_ID=483371 /ORGANISM="non described non described, Strain CCMP2298" /LENGTH=59 /DNA_ID=CAMNT_0014187283 /DNA_START=350 /DNA_END=526 /DNA_ORIENTATION=-
MGQQSSALEHHYTCGTQVEVAAGGALVSHALDLPHTAAVAADLHVHGGGGRGRAAASTV